MIIALVAQAYYLQKLNILSTLCLTFPSFLLMGYFYGAIKKSKRQLVFLDVIRRFAVLFCLVTTGNLVYIIILKIIFGTWHSGLHQQEFRAEVSYTIAYIAFPSFLYLLSCADTRSIKRDRILDA